MSRRTSDPGRALRAALLVGLLGCGDSAPASSRTIDICGRDSGLAGALAGGQLRLTIQSAAGAPIVDATVPVDRGTSVALPGAGTGDLVVVEGLDATAAPIALGSVTLDDAGGCVCLARRSWRAVAVTTESGGATRYGTHAGFLVGTPPPGLVASTPLSLDHGRVAAGDRLVVSFGFTNTTQTTLDVHALQIVARPPGATHASGLVTDFTGQPSMQLAPGATFSGQASRGFGSADPPGIWAIFARTVDALDVAHDGPELEILVGAGSEPLLPATPLRLGKSWIAPGESLHGDQQLDNRGTAPVALASALLSARAPGQADADAPSYDFSNPTSGTVAAGGSINLSGDRPFDQTADPCAGVVCTVQDGACRFSPTR